MLNPAASRLSKDAFSRKTGGDSRPGRPVLSLSWEPILYLLNRFRPQKPPHRHSRHAPEKGVLFPSRITAGAGRSERGDKRRPAPAAAD